MSDPRAVRRAIRVADAPVNWGLFGLGSAPLLTPVAYLDGVVAHGYEGTELGAPGFMGDAAATRDALARHSLALAGAYLDLRFSQGDTIEADLHELRSRARFVAEAAPPGDPPAAVLADATSDPLRLEVACRVERHPEAWLSADRFETLVTSIHRAARICVDAGLMPVIHPHAGGYIETDREIRAVCDRLDPSLVGLCLDTGHAWLGDADPLALLRDYRELVWHVHVKDVAPSVLAASREEGWPVDRTWAEGIFTELGTGAVPLAPFLADLLAGGYRGWVVVEQDRVLREGETPDGAAATSAANRDWLERQGLPR